ncbi:peptide chain release factor N(5)-glutamine methyltransferase [Clostridium sp. Marseille-P3244]|uniref:peptide chain release factor N(5)-glutamine methyltransferase n=1 Tax=Clostridium sp. Marseille-P3244 TaxID=1871020 RepID=UPI00093167CB|nr:peptide chain release factor N(5)-glutamine methyltransferase [Clostridium sp. Marseille-P3244]
MTLKEAYRQGRDRLSDAGIPEADLDAWYLLEQVTGISRARYYADPEREIPETDHSRYAAYIERRAGHVPLQHITGSQEFMGLKFRVNEHVLIPRQDTEILVEEALKILREEGLPMQEGKLRVLDLCTGSGCILLSVLYWMSQDKNRDLEIRGIGSDLSEKVLETAAENAAALGIRADFVRSDLFQDLGGKFGMILSNPPYIRTGDIDGLQEEVRLYDPRAALDGGEDGLYFYRKIIRESREYLEPGGYLMFEIGWDQAEEVSALMRASGYARIRVKKDLAGLDRVVYGVYSGRVLSKEKSIEKEEEYV